MSDSVLPPPVPSDVASAQEPWPATPAEVEPAATEEAPADEPAVADEAEEAEADAADISPMLARVAADRLNGLAGPVQMGVVVLGTLGAFHNLATSQGTSSGGTFAFLITVGFLIIGGLVARVSLSGFAALLLAQADQAESAGRTEQHVAAGLERLTAALEALAAAPRGAAAPTRSAVERKADHLAEIRQAMRSGHWAAADERLRDFVASYPDDPDLERLATDLAEARQVASQETLARIEAAREVNDPERVLELRDGLGPLLPAESLRALDRDLVRWFMTLIQRRLRAGTARSDVAVLAARVADRFDDSPEGASLRASLPTLRRAAGLCARCGQPYKGVAAACPACQAAPRSAAIPQPDPSAQNPSPEEPAG